jgi:hypothetical protein
MISRHLRDSIQRFNFIGSSGLIFTGAAALALCVTACFAPLIPLALQGAEVAGKVAIEGMQSAKKEGKDQNTDEAEPDEQTKFADSEFDVGSSDDSANSGKCNELELVTPSIIQFHTDDEGITQWRELGLGGSSDAPRWIVVTAATRDVALGGWAPASNLDRMDFNPPLKTSKAPGYTTFLAYAPKSSLSSIERDQLASLLDFGAPIGTFKYNERVFRYLTLKTLPCFPVPQ